MEKVRVVVAKIVLPAKVRRREPRLFRAEFSPPRR